MSTVANQFDDETQQQQNQGQGQTPTLGAAATPTSGNTASSSPTQTSAPSVGGPQGGGVATPGGGSGGSNASPQATNSGSYNNIQKYIDANQGFNQQGGGLAGKITNNINTQAQGFQNNLQGAQDAFSTANQASTNSFTNPGLVNQAIENPTAFVNGTQAQGQPGQDGYVPAQSAGDLNTFNAIRDANYTGPKSLQDLSGSQNLANLQQQSSSLNDTVNQAQSEAGRFNLLKQMFGNNDYNKGQQNLDNLLIEGNQGQLKQIQGVRQVAQDASTNLNNANLAAQQSANQATQQAASTSADVRNRLNQSVIDQNTNLNNAATAAQQKQQTDIANLYKAISSGSISPDQQAMLGSNPTQIENQLQGLRQFMGINGQMQSGFVQPLTSFDPSFLAGAANGGIPGQVANALNDFNSQYTGAGVNLTGGDLVSSGLAPTAQNIATSNDYAKLSALNQLLGGSGANVGSVANTDASALLAQYLPNASQAGTFNPNVSLNLSALKNMINSANSSTQNMLTDTQVLEGKPTSINGNQAFQFDPYPGQMDALKGLDTQEQQILQYLAGNNSSGQISGIGGLGGGTNI